MDKQHILDEIKRTTKANDGKPLGEARFEKETGIKKFDWYPHYWIRWGDALQEVGFSPNKLQGAYDENKLVEKYAGFIRELGHFPVTAEVRRKSKLDSSFPSHNVLGFARFGGKKQLATKIINFCKTQNDWDDVIELCTGLANSEEQLSEESSNFASGKPAGVVYLMKSGRYYKIGRSNDVGRRKYDLAIQLPEDVKTVHTIKTDDPAGIEAYWHKRFEDKRKRGEWFELTAEDIKAFKRRKFMQLFSTNNHQEPFPLSPCFSS